MDDYDYILTTNNTILSSGMNADQYDGDAITAALVNAANDRGGVDNITVVLMRLGMTKNDEAKDDNA